MYVCVCVCVCVFSECLFCMLVMGENEGDRALFCAQRGHSEQKNHSHWEQRASKDRASYEADSFRHTYLVHTCIYIYM